MKINNIFTQNLNFQQNIQKNNTFNKSANFSKPIANNLSGLSKDTFCPAFKGGEADVIKFSKLLDNFQQTSPKEQPLLLKELNGLFEKVFDHITKDPKHFIGSGSSNNVYKIDENYVLRANMELGQASFDASGLKVVDNNKTTENLKTYYGAKLFRSGDIAILKNADPDKTAIPLGKPFLDDYDERLNSRSFCAKMDEQFEKSVKKLATLPQKAYDKIAADMKLLETTQPVMFFDYKNPNNFLIVNDEIRTVDDIVKSDRNGRNNLSSMLQAFLTEEQVSFPSIFNENLVGSRQEILKKCILSGEKNELDFGGDDLNKIFTKSLRLAGYDTQQPLLQKLKDIRKEYPDINKRMDAVAEILGKLI